MTGATLHGGNKRAPLALASIAIAFAVVSTSPPPAFAQSKEELAQARDLFAKAERDEQSQDWKAALEKLERAIAIKATAGLRFHLALCLEKLGRLTEALASYELAATQARNDNARDVLDAVQDPLNDLRARVPSVTLDFINCSADDVNVSVDDRAIPAGALLSPVRLMPGTHRIVAVRKADGRSFERQIKVEEREVVSLGLALPVQPTAPAPAASATPPPAETPAHTKSLVPPILATAGAVVLAGAGVGMFITAGSAQDDLRRCTNTDDCNDKRQPVRTFDALALGGFVGGAALATVAIVLWVNRASGAPASNANITAPPPARVSLDLGPTRAALVGSF